MRGTGSISRIGADPAALPVHPLLVAAYLADLAPQDRLVGAGCQAGGHHPPSSWQKPALEQQASGHSGDPARHHAPAWQTGAAGGGADLGRSAAAAGGMRQRSGRGPGPGAVSDLSGRRAAAIRPIGSILVSSTRTRGPVCRCFFPLCLPRGPELLARAAVAATFAAGLELARSGALAMEQEEAEMIRFVPVSRVPASIPKWV
jgi:hypothetical protein